MTAVRLMRESDLELVLSWRNCPDISRFMFSSHAISFEEHQTWFARASIDPEQRLLIFESDTIPLGFINIHQDMRSLVADWGFYAAPSSPKGTGHVLGRTALRYAFEKLKLHRLCGRVLAYNERSIRLHRRLGFQHEGVLRQHHFNGQQYHDVVCFGLLVHEWDELN